MKLEQSFMVIAPLETVWAALTDVERVAPCLPGASLSPGGEDGAYEGTFSVKLGPATAAYQGTLEIAAMDTVSHTTTMRASGRDKRGQGSASATIVSHLVADGDGTRVEVETDFTITGRLARFGRGGMIQDVSNRLLKDFSKCLAATIEAEPSPRQAPSPALAATPARPVKGFSLLLSVLWERLKRLFGR